MGREGREHLAINPKPFGLTQGLTPHSEELQLQPMDVTRPWQQGISTDRGHTPSQTGKNRSRASWPITLG
jgi:hypothetical protein